MAVPTWSQLTFLTGPQQAKAAEFAAIGNAYSLYLGHKGPLPDLSGVTQSQAKTARALLKDLGTLVGPAEVGIKYATTTFEAAAMAEYQAENP
jgi:hypothetical protein